MKKNNGNNDNGKDKKDSNNQDFKRTLWKTADSLRAQMDAAEYKHIVLGLIFLKYISDSFSEQKEKIKEIVTNPDSDFFISENLSDINEQDFLDRAELLCSSGKTVMITNFQEYYKLSDYFSKYSDKKRVLTMGVDNLIKVFDESYYNTLSGGILEAFGKLFKKNTEVYLYPMLKGNKLINSTNLQVHDNMKNLYKFFKDNNKIIDINDYDPTLLNIFSWEVLEEIKKGSNDWEYKLPKTISKLIKEKKLFGYKG